MRQHPVHPCFLHPEKLRRLPGDKKQESAEKATISAYVTTSVQKAKAERDLTAAIDHNVRFFVSCLYKQMYFKLHFAADITKSVGCRRLHSSPEFCNFRLSSVVHQ